MRALVVDDSLPARRHAGRMLADLGFEVYEAVHGEDALAALTKLGEVELVVLDWNMPYADGMWFLRAVRRERRWDGVQIVMATGNSDAESVAQALSEGASEYVMKPFGPEDLRGKLEILGFSFGAAEA
jgi:two-component system chemotaxis response regulator CheY